VLLPLLLVPLSRFSCSQAATSAVPICVTSQQQSRQWAACCDRPNAGRAMHLEQSMHLVSHWLVLDLPSKVTQYLTFISHTRASSRCANITTAVSAVTN
jgi:hypothetical protein